MAVFEEPEIYLPNMAPVFKKTNTTETVTIPFDYHHLDVSNTKPITFKVKSSNAEIVRNNSISIVNKQLTFSLTGSPGYTELDIEATDGETKNDAQLPLYIFPDGDVFLYSIPNKIVEQNSEELSSRLSIQVVQIVLPSYGTPQFEITSSNPDFFIDEKVTEVVQHPIFNIWYNLSGSSYDPSVSKESRITVTATDGTSSHSRSFWFKVGSDAPPEAVGVLLDYSWSTGSPFDYVIPAGSFTDPEGNALKFSSGNLPYGLDIDPETGSITGTSDKITSFEVTITATDRYNQSATHTLQVIVNNPVASPTNVAPMVTEIADQTLEINGVQTIDLTGFFVDTEALVFKTTISDASVVTATVSDIDDNMLILTGLSAGMTSITVTATDTGGLAVSTTFEVTVNTSPTAILETLPVQQQDIFVYRNPVSGFFILRMVNAFRGRLKIRVLDMSGKALHSYEREKRSEVLEAAVEAGSLGRGIYLLEVQADQQVWIRKVIKN